MSLDCEITSTHLMSGNRGLVERHSICDVKSYLAGGDIAEQKGKGAGEGAEGEDADEGCGESVQN